MVRTDSRRQRLRLQIERLEARNLLFASGFNYDQVSPTWFESLGQDDGPRDITGFAQATATGINDTTFSNNPDLRRWIVRFTEQALQGIDSVGETERLLTGSAVQFTVIRGLGLPGLVEVETTEPERERVEEAYQANPNVAYHLLDSLVVSQALPSDPLVSEQWGLQNRGIDELGKPDGIAGADIDADAAFEITTGRRDVIVGVVDSGVDYTHPDLYQNIWINPGEIPNEIAVRLTDTDRDGVISFVDLNHVANQSLTIEGQPIVVDGNGNGFIDAGDLIADTRWFDGIDNDANGFVDDLHGYDFNDNDSDPFDDSGHGTHVSGTIAAIGNNGLGVAGVAYSTTLMPLKFLTASDLGATANATRAINYATMMREQYDQGVRVINNSWGGDNRNPGLLDAINISQAADILLVAGAGNGDLNRAGVNNDETPFYPASYGEPDGIDNIIAVTASGKSDELAPFANFGGTSVDLTAPGVSILSTLPGGTFGFRHGTSMAAAFVSGAAALQFADVPDATFAEVRDSILGSVDLLPSTADRGKVTTGGRLNAAAMLSLDTVAPRISISINDDFAFQGTQPSIVTVRFTDNVAIDVSESLPLPGSDPTTASFRLVVTRDDDPTFEVELLPVSVSPEVDSASVIATYEFAPPGGSWDISDNGTYQLVVQGQGVKDLAGNSAREFPLTTTRFVETESLFIEENDFARTPETTFEDLNGDGLPDLVVAVFSSSELKILINNGSGQFTDELTLTVPDTIRGFAFDDFNRNGIPDLVVVSDESPEAQLLYDFDLQSSGFLTSSTLSLADGRQGNQATPLHPNDVVVGDFDGDGNSDLAFSLLSNRIAIARNDGTGEFESPTFFETSSRNIDNDIITDVNGIGAYSLAGFTNRLISVGNFDGDDHLDLAVLTLERSHHRDDPADQLVILHNDGSGDFQDAEALLPGTDDSAPIDVSVADLNSDGIDDLVATSFLFELTPVTTLQSEPGDQFGIKRVPGSDFPDTGPGNRSELLDLDGDGDFDFVNTAIIRDEDFLNILVWFENDGTGNFRERTISLDLAYFFTPLFSGGTLPSADVDGDGDLDLFAGGAGTILQFVNESKRTFGGRFEVDAIPLEVTTTLDKRVAPGQQDTIRPRVIDRTLRSAILEANQFDGLDQIVLPEGTFGLAQRRVGLRVPDEGFSPTGIVDGDLFSFTIDGVTATFEFDSNSFPLDPTALRVEVSDGAGPDQVAAAIQTAIQNAGLGLDPQLDGQEVFFLTDGPGTASGKLMLVEEASDNVGLIGDLDITDDLIIEGAGADLTFIDGNQLDRILHILPGATVTISGVTIRGGKGDAGTGIRNQGTLVLDEVIITSNQSSTFGGGIFNSGVLTITNSTIAGNTADEGGGIYNDGELDLISSTISSNSASLGGGIQHSGRARSRIDQSTITANYASLRGGGISGSNSRATPPGPEIFSPSVSEAFGGDGSQGIAIVERTPNNDTIFFPPAAVFLETPEVSGGGPSVGADFDGDGIDDLLLVSDRNGGATIETHVVYGRSSSTHSDIDFDAFRADSDPQTGFSVTIADQSQLEAITFFAAGDLNGDGRDDLLFPNLVGEPDTPIARLLLGESQRQLTSLSLLNPDPRLIEIVDGPDTEHGNVGVVFPLGDINGDGFDDVSFTTLDGTVGGAAGTVDYILLDPVDQDRALDPSDVIVFGSVDSFGDPTEYLVRSAGNFLANPSDPTTASTDGIMIVGPNALGGEGVLYLYTHEELQQLASLDSNCQPIAGGPRPIEFGDELAGLCPGLGRAVAVEGGILDAGIAGDINNDGLDDLYVTGEFLPTFILFGGQPFPEQVNDINFVGSAMPGPFVVRSAGDFNGDGIEDFLVGFPGPIPISWLVLGTEAGLTAQDLDPFPSDPFDSVTPAILVFGSDPTAIGDVNNDGRDDLLTFLPDQEVDSGPSGGTEAYVLYGQADPLQNPSIEVRNSVVDGNTSGEVGGGNVVAEIDLIGANFVNLDDSLLLDALLGPLTDNGGPTPTHVPLPGSPLIDAGDDANAASRDQRGSVRILDGNGDGVTKIDLGAVEFSSFSVNSIIDSVDADPSDDAGVDAAGNATLRAAIQQANVTAGPDTITLASETYALTIAGQSEDSASTGDLDVTDDLTIIGQGPGQTIIDAANLDRVFDLLPGTTLTLRDLTITGGSTSENSDSTSEVGGGIRAAGDLTLINVVIENNLAEDGGGGLHIVAGGSASIERSTFEGNEVSGTRDAGGGAIRNQGTLNVDASSIVGNTAATRGGGILNLGNAVIDSTTIASNRADRGAGWFQAAGRTTVVNSTISNNRADQGSSSSGGGIFQTSGVLTIDSSTVAENLANDGGGGVFNQTGTIRVASSIIAKNSAVDGADANGTFQSLGHNLVGDPTSATGFTGGVNQDIVGVAAGDVALGALQDNGGPTLTHLPLFGSPAIDAGNATAARDQRGAPRIDADIGAVERADNTVFVRNTDDSLTVADDPTTDCGAGTCSLRSAIIEGNDLGQTYTIVLEAGDYTLSLEGADEDGARSGDLDVTGTIEIFAAGDGLTTIDANGIDRVFHVHSSGSLSLVDLKVTGGNSSSAGGGIFNEGILDLTDAEVSGNQSIGNGGGISNLAGTLRVDRSTISANQAQQGGGIYSTGTLEVLTSSIISNTAATNGGGLMDEGTSEINASTIALNRARVGGGVFGSNPTIDFINSTISSNNASEQIGAASASGGILRFDSSTVYGNSALNIAGIDASLVDSLLLRNTIVAGNVAPEPREPNAPRPITDGIGFFDSQGNNLFGDRGDPEFPAAQGLDDPSDLAGNRATPIDPVVGVLVELGDNRGRTLTHALAAGSPAVDRGATSLTADQRGLPRPFDGNNDGIAVPDIGAFELVIDTQPPHARLGDFGLFISPGSPTHQIELVFSDAAGIDLLTIDDDDLVVTTPLIDANTGQPTTIPARVHDIAIDSASGDTRVVYEFVAPGGSWDAADDGTYTAAVRANQVSDINGNFVGAFTINFEVEVATTAYPQIGVFDATAIPDPPRPDGIITFSSSDFQVNDFSVNTSVEFYVDVNDDGLINRDLDVPIFESPLDGLNVASLTITGGELVDIRGDRSVTVLAAIRGTDPVRGAVDVLGFPRSATVNVIELDGPTAELSAPDFVSSAADATYNFTVTYRDETGVDFDSVAFDDELLRVTGPNDFETGAIFVNAAASDGGKLVNATYQVTLPGGSIDDNGFYSVLVRGGRVKDTNGNTLGETDAPPADGVVVAAGIASDALTLPPGSAALLGQFSFEFVSPPEVTGSISGIVFDDKNSNGDQDEDEPGLANQAVYLDLNHNGQFDSGVDAQAITDGSGSYTINYTDVPTGRYAVLFDGPRTVTSPNASNFSTQRITASRRKFAISVASGHFDSDSAPDLVVANYNEGSIAIRPNASAGSLFDQETLLDAPDGPFFVATGQLDTSTGDDIVTVNEIASSVSVFLNDGSGEFIRQDVPLLGQDNSNLSPTSVAIGDMDGDGDSDLAVSIRDNAVAILLNQGLSRADVAAGQSLFSDPMMLPLPEGSLPTSLALHKLDEADDRVDLAVATIGDNRVTIFYSSDVLAEEVTSAADLFSATQPIDLAAVPISILAGNFKGDPATDIAVARRASGVEGTSGEVLILRNDGNRQFAADNEVLGSASALTSLAAADLDGDNVLDLIASTNTNRNVAVFNRAQSGEFDEEQSFPIAQIPVTFQFSVATADVDLDQRPDLLVSDANGVSILRNARGGHVVDLTVDRAIENLSFGTSDEDSNVLAIRGGATLDLSTVSDGELTGIDTIDIRGDGVGDDNTLLLNADRVRTAFEGGTLIVIADQGDTVVFDAGWEFTGAQSVGGELVRIFEQNGARVELTGPEPLTNPILSGDVNASGTVTPLDALIIIGELTRRRFSDAATGSIQTPLQADLSRFNFFDTSGDLRITALDALRVVNDIAIQQVTGSSAAAEQVTHYTTGNRLKSIVDVPVESMPPVPLQAKIASHTFNSGGAARYSPAERPEAATDRKDLEQEFVDELLGNDFREWLSF